MERKVKVRDLDVMRGDLMSVAKRSEYVAERMLLVVLLIALLLVPGAMARACTPATGIVVTPVADVGDGVEVQSIVGTIHPGEYQTIEKPVPTGVRSIVVNLDWSGHQHPGTDLLTLTITLPGSAALGPYHDGADGRTDEKIALTLSGSDSLPSGTWKFLIFGEDVPEEGTEYTLNVIYYY
ncbi:hypothetical protein ACK11Z_15350 [Methanoculleus bourgensis]|uniref:hypothetical protein n=1 Tax=Methanoculleus bourgensis TaxID=83986 RepID=UPI003B935505